MEKISVITVCFNAVSTLEKTILSVLNQTYPNIEYIIIDGGSTDGSVDIIKKYADRLAYWVSEPDNGIYDAMNKGAAAASGNWVNFMNAGDSFYCSETVSTLFVESINENVASVFGNTIFRYSEKDVLVEYKSSMMHSIMPSCHQSIFCRREVLLNFPFNLRYKIAADYDFFNRIKKAGYQYKFVNTIVAVYDATSGISSRLIMRTRKEIYRIKYPIWLSFILYSLFCIKYLIKNGK